MRWGDDDELIADEAQGCLESLGWGMESGQRGSHCSLTSGIPHFFLLHKATETNFLFSCVLGPDKLLEDARKESSERE